MCCRADLSTHCPRCGRLWEAHPTRQTAGGCTQRVCPSAQNAYSAHEDAPGTTIVRTPGLHPSLPRAAIPGALRRNPLKGGGGDFLGGGQGVLGADATQGFVADVELLSQVFGDVGWKWGWGWWRAFRRRAGGLVGVFLADMRQQLLAELPAGPERGAFARGVVLMGPAAKGAADGQGLWTLGHVGSLYLYGSLASHGALN